MIELLVLGSLLLAAVVVIGTLATVGALIGGLVLLPFRILGWVLRVVLGGAVALVIGLPVLLIGLVVGGVGLALGVGLVAVPLLPFVALGALVWWLVKPRGPRKTETSGATVVG